MAMKPTDQEIGDLYREAGGAEPSAALDHSILLAARAAVAPKPTATPWGHRWRLPIPVLASLIVAGALVILVEREPPDTPGLGPVALNTPPAEPVGAASRSVEKSMPPLAEKRARITESVPVRRLPAAPQAGAAREALALPAEPAAAAPAPVAKAAPMAADAASPAMATSEAASGAKARMAARQAAAPATNTIPPAREWLDAIQRLIDQGRIVEARTSLEDFERAYPASVVPDGVRNQLKQ